MGLPNKDDQLVIERRVGRGRIVVTAFRITGPEFTGWPGCDCFFNACLLRRGPREISITSTTGRKPSAGPKRRKTLESHRSEPAATTQPVPDASTAMPATPTPTSPAGAIVNSPVASETHFSLIPSPSTGTLNDAATNTNVRYFSRDAGVPFQSYASDISSPQAAVGMDDSGNPVDANGNIVSGNNAIDVESEDPASNSYERKAVRRVSAPGTTSAPWPRPRASALNNGFRDHRPGAELHFWVVVGYLCVLVPANWLVFRSIGRVEWAWIAAPLIAIGCTRGRGASGPTEHRLRRGRETRSR